MYVNRLRAPSGLEALRSNKLGKEQGWKAPKNCVQELSVS